MIDIEAVRRKLADMYGEDGSFAELFERAYWQFTNAELARTLGVSEFWIREKVRALGVKRKMRGRHSGRIFFTEDEFKIYGPRELALRFATTPQYIRKKARRLGFTGSDDTTVECPHGTAQSPFAALRVKSPDEGRDETDC